MRLGEQVGLLRGTSGPEWGLMLRVLRSAVSADG